eukprot:gene21037-25245_t
MDSEDLDLNCPICFETLLDPVVTPCGHCFDKRCLTTALASSRSCPKCRCTLVDATPFEVCIPLRTLIKQCFPAEVAERQSRRDKDISLISAAAGTRGTRDKPLKAVTELLRTGASVHVTLDDGTTALHVARDPLTVAALLEAGARRDARDAFGRTPLHRAANAKVLRALLQGLEGPARREALAADSAREEGGEETGLTPLHCALYDGRSMVAQALLQCGAPHDVYTRNAELDMHDGSSARSSSMVDCAIDYANGHDSTGAWDGLLVLLRHLVAQHEDLGDLMPRVAGTGNLESVAVLLAAGVDANQTDDEGRVPLIEATTNGGPRAVEQLLAAGARVNDRNIEDNTALAEAAHLWGLNGDSEYVRVARLLLKAGAHVEGCCSAKTPLGLACHELQHVNSDLSMPKLLLEAGADPHRQYRRGGPAIIGAVESNNIALMQLLMKHGAKSYDQSATEFYHAQWSSSDPILVAIQNEKWEALQIMQLPMSTGDAEQKKERQAINSTIAEALRFCFINPVDLPEGVSPHGLIAMQRKGRRAIFEAIACITEPLEFLQSLGALNGRFAPERRSLLHQ